MMNMTPVQYNLLSQQTKKYIQAKTTSSDPGVIAAVYALVEQELSNQIEHIHESQLLPTLQSLTDHEDAAIWLNDLKKFVTPFTMPSQKQLEKLFKREKKVKVPTLTDATLTRAAFISWDDSTSRRRFYVAQDNELVGVSGTFATTSKKGICTICNHHTETTIFTATVKFAGNQDQYKSFTHHVCSDTVKCSEQVTNAEQILSFFQKCQP